jgi:hypothetical protein
MVVVMSYPTDFEVQERQEREAANRERLIDQADYMRDRKREEMIEARSKNSDTLSRLVFVCDHTTKWEWHRNPVVMTHNDAVQRASEYQRRCDDLGVEYAVAIIAAYGSEVYVTASTGGRYAQEALTRLPRRD